METSRSTPGDRVFRFGPFVLSERDGELHKNGVRIKLQEQPFRVLVELVANAGKVVTREELQQKLWPADTFVDFNVGVNTAIRKLRLALNDEADKPRYIETLSKRGYRFIAEVMIPKCRRMAARSCSLGILRISIPSWISPMPMGRVSKRWRNPASLAGSAVPIGRRTGDMSSS